MPRFLLLLAPEYRSGAELSPAELGARTARFAQWVAGLRREGTLRGGGRLDPHAMRVTLDPDGPRIESGSGGAAAVGHFFVIETSSWGSACAAATSCPGARPGSVDVFAIDTEPIETAGGCR